MPDRLQQLHALSQQIPAFGLSSGRLHQSQMYRDVDVGPYGNAYGGYEPRSNFLPMVTPNSIQGMAYNFIHPFVDPLLKRTINNRYDRFAAPISSATVNVFDLINAEKRYAFTANAPTMGQALDKRRVSAFINNLQQRADLDLGEGIFRTGAEIFGGMGLNHLQGGSFAGLNAMLSQAAQLEGRNVVSGSQINDLSSLIEQTGFRNKGRIGVNTAFTRGLGINAIGAGVNELQRRGLFNFGTDVDTALLAGRNLGTDDTNLFKRRKEISDILDKADIKDSPNNISQEVRDALSKELDSLSAVSDMSLSDRRLAFNTLKNRQLDSLMGKGISYKDALQQVDTTFSNIHEGKNLNQLVTELKTDAAERLKKQVGGLLELSEVLGDIFESASGNVPELLKRLDVIDSRALSTTSTRDVANILRDTRYIAQTAGFDQEQMVTIMAEAANKSRQYGLSFQEGQSIAQQNMLARSTFRSQGSTPIFGKLSGQEFAQEDMEFRMQAAGSDAMDIYARFLAGVDFMQSTGMPVSEEDAQLAAAIRSGSTSEISNLIRHPADLTARAPYNHATAQSAGRMRADNADLFTGLSFENAAKSINKDTANLSTMAILANNKDVQAMRAAGYDPSAGIQGVMSFLQDDAKLLSWSSYSDPKKAAQRLDVSMEKLNKVFGASDSERSEIFNQWRDSVKDGTAREKAQVEEQIKGLQKVIATASPEELSSLQTMLNKKGMRGTIISQSSSSFEHVVGRDKAATQSQIKENADINDKRQQLERSLVDAKMSKYMSDMGFNYTTQGNLLNAVGAEDGGLLETLLNTVAPQSLQAITDVQKTGLESISSELSTNLAKKGLSATDVKAHQLKAMLSITKKRSYQDYLASLLPSEKENALSKEEYEGSKGETEKIIDMDKVNVEANNIGAQHDMRAYETYLLKGDAPDLGEIASNMHKFSKDTGDTNLLRDISAAVYKKTGGDAAAINKIIGKKGSSTAADLVHQGISEYNQIQTTAHKSFESAHNLLKTTETDKAADYAKKLSAFDKLGFSEDFLKKTYGKNMGIDELKSAHEDYTREKSNRRVGREELTISGSLSLMDDGGNVVLKAKDLKLTKQQQ